VNLDVATADLAIARLRRTVNPDLEDVVEAGLAVVLDIDDE